jgi:hypothetical protein
MYDDPSHVHLCRTFVCTVDVCLPEMPNVTLQPVSCGLSSESMSSGKQPCKWLQTSHCWGTAYASHPFSKSCIGRTRARLLFPCSSSIWRSCCIRQAFVTRKGTEMVSHLRIARSRVWSEDQKQLSLHLDLNFGFGQLLLDLDLDLDPGTRTEVSPR